MAQLARKYNIPYKVFKFRIERGWEINRAVHTPLRKSPSCYIIDKDKIA